MAKTEGDQSIPSALLDAYRATLGEQRPNKVIEKRYPYRVPTLQDIKGHPSAKQRIQRDRLKTAVGNFNKISSTERARWYAAMPPYSSLLWYYNYFIMSSLAGNADISDGGAGVIKSIQNVKASVPVSGGQNFTIATVDPAKTVVMVYGNSYIADLIQRHSGNMNDNAEVTINLSPSIQTDIAEMKVSGGGGHQETAEGSGEGDWGDIVGSYLSTTQAKIKLAQLGSGATFPYQVEIIEHKAQTIYPIISEILTTGIMIDWSKQPSVAADVSMIAIEYI